MPTPGNTRTRAVSPNEVSQEEIARFSRLAPQWWDADGPMRPLHQMNPLRIGWIDARIAQRPARLLDIGCGAGLASEALSRAGHDVLGIDASADAIAVAIAHAAEGGLSTSYRVGLAQDLAGEAGFDAITALEIIEHVPDQPAFMRTLAGLLAPRGMLFVSTLNRTWRSLAVAKIGAEYIARLLPAGTHDWRAFVRPDELAAQGRAAGLRLSGIAGLSYVMSSGTWRETGDVSINYIAAFNRA